MKICRGLSITLIVSREEEKSKLIQRFQKASRFVVIDSKNNMDKNSIVNLLKDYKKEIVLQNI
jgi:predicted Fe-Mo cluster-binding NifX family protein